MEKAGLNHEAAIGLHAAEVHAVSPDLVAAFDIDPIPDGAPLAPLVFASPHSGDIYPSSMIEALRLRPDQLRSSEDSLVDALIAPAPALGACVIRARVARAFVDLNRATFELDPEMYADELPEFARVRTARVAAGLGTLSSPASASANMAQLVDANTAVKTVAGGTNGAVTIRAGTGATHTLDVSQAIVTTPTTATRGGGTVILEAGDAITTAINGPQEDANRPSPRIEIAPVVVVDVAQAIKGIDSRTTEGITEMFRIMRGGAGDVQEQQLSVLEEIAANTGGEGFTVVEDF
jgi:hypothetical protein